MKRRKEYALYKGDKFLDIGTRQELAEKFNVSIDTITFWATPANLKRLASRNVKENNAMIAVKLGFETED